MRYKNLFNAWSVAVMAFLSINHSTAAIINATPADYQSKVSNLIAGDTLNLAAGTYPLLAINGLHGTAAQRITIQGPLTGAPAIITVKPSNTGCCNVIQLEDNTAYLALKNLRVDSAGYNAINGLQSRGTTHDILIENCTFVGQNLDQENVAISTKGIAWNWTIRRNKIIGAGTGMYLGNSAGNYPFVNGIIEQNYVADTLGYNIQVKWQLPYALPAGLSNVPHKTIIRDNVLLKRKAQSQFPVGTTVGARPNLLVGGFPSSGAGSNDFYEIYGNFFYDNRDNEALFQGSGRVVFHDNVLVGGNYRAATFQNHDLPIKIAYAFNNTVYAHSAGIVVSGTPQASLVAGNLVLADTGITAPVQKNNLFAPFASASNYVNHASLTLGAMDFYPKVNTLATGAVLDLTPFSNHIAYNKDFNGKLKTNLSYRGAYAGAGFNTGWLPNASIKLPTVSSLTALQQTAVVNTHNQWRSAVNVPAIKWSNSVASTAQAWVNSLKVNQGCHLAHSNTAGLGENLYWASAISYSNGTTAPQAITPAQVVNTWGNEKSNYNYNTNTCATGTSCGHYTQVVWKNTTEVGCGKAVCADNSQVWACLYAPAGNYSGQKPY